MPEIDMLMLTLAFLLSLGAITFSIGLKTGISTIPLLILFGFLVGPVAGLIDHQLAHDMFEYVRVFGLAIILFTEGHSLRWSLLKKHLVTIGVLDSVGLLITALVAAFFFSWLFDLPFLVGFLFGAIIAATDPATLVPLFQQNKVDKDIETVIVTESIFNDPLGIVLTILAIALLVPSAPEAQVVERLAEYTTLYPAAVLFFLYQIGGAIVLGIVLAHIAYKAARPFVEGHTPILMSLAVGLGGFALGDLLQVSGYLVATVIGILFGNQKVFFRKDPHLHEKEEAEHVSVGFNEVISDFATVFIFLLLGASLELEAFESGVWNATLVALAVIFIARPLAVAALLPLGRWSFREYLFISLEGPRGVVPSAMAGTLLALGLAQNNPELTAWGHVVMTTAVITVLISVLLETLWVSALNKHLLQSKSTEQVKE